MSPPNCCYCFICKKSLSFADGIHFFIFPWKQPEKLQRWFTSLGLADKPNSLQPTLRSHICSLHFQHEDLKRCGKRVRLLPHAVPQLMDNQPRVKESLVSENEQLLSETAISRLCSKAADNQFCAAPEMRMSKSQSQDPPLPGSATMFVHEASINHQLKTDCDVQQTMRIIQPFMSARLTKPAKVSQPVTQATEELAEPMHITVEIDPFDLGEDSDNTDDLENSDAGSVENGQKPLTPATRDNTNQLHPASCAPEDSDTPCEMKKKIAVLYSAYQSLKKRNKTALQSIRRLKKENTTLKSMLKQFQSKTEESNVDPSS